MLILVKILLKHFLIFFYNKVTLTNKFTTIVKKFFSFKHIKYFIMLFKRTILFFFIFLICLINVLSYGFSYLTLTVKKKQFFIISFFLYFSKKINLKLILIKLIKQTKKKIYIFLIFFYNRSKSFYKLNLSTGFNDFAAGTKTLSLLFYESLWSVFLHYETDFISKEEFFQHNKELWETKTKPFLKYVRDNILAYPKFLSFINSLKSDFSKQEKIFPYIQRKLGLFFERYFYFLFIKIINIKEVDKKLLIFFSIFLVLKVLKVIVLFILLKSLQFDFFNALYLILTKTVLLRASKLSNFKKYYEFNRLPWDLGDWIFRQKFKILPRMFRKLFKYAPPEFFNNFFGRFLFEQHEIYSKKWFLIVIRRKLKRIWKRRSLNLIFNFLILLIRWIIILILKAIKFLFKIA